MIKVATAAVPQTGVTSDRQQQPAWATGTPELQEHEVLLYKRCALHSGCCCCCCCCFELLSVY